MNKDVLSHRNKNEIPGINCIVKSDGSVIILNSYRVVENNRYYAFPLCETTIESLLKYNEEIWAEIQSFTKFDAGSNIIFLAGEGAMGNEGFVACTDSFNNLKWALFCENSNPFNKIELVGQNLHVSSTSDLEYKIEINNPEIITIINHWRCV